MTFHSIFCRFRGFRDTFGRSQGPSKHARTEKTIVCNYACSDRQVREGYGTEPVKKWKNVTLTKNGRLRVNLDQTKPKNEHVRVTGRLIFSWFWYLAEFCTNSLYIRLSLDIFSLFLETWSLEPAYAMEEISQSQISKTSTLPSFDSPLFYRQEFTHYYELLIYKRFSKFSLFKKILEIFPNFNQKYNI